MAAIQADSNTHDPSGDATAVARREAEEAIARHKEVILEEKRVIAASSRILNSLLPVAKLLPEILSEIFIHIAVDPFGYNKNTTPSALPPPHQQGHGKAVIGPYNWIVITHVCHRWREAALRSPRLWSFIYLGPKDQVQEFLARSGQVPLRIRPWAVPQSNDVMPLWNQGNLRSLKSSVLAFSLRQVLAQSHRIESLSLTLPTPVLDRVFGEFKDGFSAPRLRSLSFAAHGDSNFPNILSVSHLPELTKVTINGYFIPWNHSFLRAPSITSLALHPSMFFSPTPFVQDTMRHLLGVLSHLPRLEDLCLSHGYTTDGDSLQGLPTAHLPCLQKLKLCSSASNIDAFLTYCTFPPTAVSTFEVPTRQGGTYQYWGGTPQGETNWITLHSLIMKSVDVIQGYKPLTGLSIELRSASADPPNEAAPTFKSHIIISTYHFDPDSVSVYNSMHLPDPRFRVEVVYTGLLDAPDLLHHLLLGLPHGQTRFIHVSSSPDATLNIDLPKTGKFFANLISRCCPTGLEALQVTGQCVDILPSIITSWNSVSLDEDGLMDHAIDVPTPRFDPHSPNPALRGLFGCIRTLVLTDLRRSIKRRRVSHSAFTMLCDTIRSQRKYYRDQCGPFTKLVLQRCTIERDWLFDLVDSIAELSYQQGRFIEHLPPEPFDPWIVIPPSPIRTPSPEPFLGNHLALPDMDLDVTMWPPHTDLPLLPAIRTGDWADHVRYGRVTFDFRGQQHIEVERDLMVKPLMGPW